MFSSSSGYSPLLPHHCNTGQVSPQGKNTLSIPTVHTGKWGRRRKKWLLWGQMRFLWQGKSLNEHELSLPWAARWHAASHLNRQWWSSGKDAGFISHKEGWAHARAPQFLAIPQQYLVGKDQICAETASLYTGNICIKRQLPPCANTSGRFQNTNR